MGFETRLKKLELKLKTNLNHSWIDELTYAEFLNLTFEEIERELAKAKEAELIKRIEIYKQTHRGQIPCWCLMYNEKGQIKEEWVFAYANLSEANEERQ